MNKKFVSLMLVGLLLNLFLYSTTRANNPEKEAKYARKVKSEIMRLGSGPQTDIKVRLRDNSKISGYLGEVGENNFTVVDKQTAKTTSVEYSKVKKASGKNHLSGQTILVGIGIVLFILMIVSIAVSDTGI